MDKIIITGATGFIGSHLVDIFVKNCLKPVCLIRKSSNIEFIDTDKVELQYGEILDLSSLNQIFDQGDFVVTCACCPKPNARLFTCGSDRIFPFRVQADLYRGLIQLLKA